MIVYPGSVSVRGMFFFSLHMFVVIIVLGIVLEQGIRGMWNVIRSLGVKVLPFFMCTILLCVMEQQIIIAWNVHGKGYVQKTGHLFLVKSIPTCNYMSL